MKELLKKIQKFTVSDLKKKHAMTAPYRDWGIIVVLFITGFVASVGFNIYLFMRINKDILVAPALKEETVSLSRGKIVSVLEYFDTKDAAFEKLKNEPLSAVDPSL